jgi:hypothetical protein
MGLRDDARPAHAISVSHLRTLACVALLFASCAGSAAVEAPPPKVPLSLVPKSLQSGTLKLYENTGKSTKAAFKTGSRNALIGEGRLWEIRDHQRLVGALEIATVRPKVRLRSTKVRKGIVNEVMPGRVDELTVGDVTVYSTSSNDKVVYMWFGKKLFEILQLKGSTIDPEGLLTDVVGYQTATDDRAEQLILDVQ